MFLTIEKGELMIIWLNGAFGSGKTTVAFELNKRLSKSFVYDPENLGFFIRHNIPENLHKDNFQDHDQWRYFNYDLLKYVAESYDGIIIVPMTIINIEYYQEIIERLKKDGIRLDHYILYANKKTLNRRLNKRLELGETFARVQMDDCIEFFDNIVTEYKIYTDQLNVDQVVNEVAQKSQLKLLKNRNWIKRKLDRILTTFKHIR
ncbi:MULTISPECIES: AAA family ATPase [Mammaliicoccus]|uniref:AAA family ATPase n=2 Tax=Mammaliicoccus TaxID=2803850 RepID=UPI001EFC0598|nr:AAA family ATPase [Mammaliicoccus sp. D-M19]CAG7914573.1 Tunicamycin resistance protein [Mammaliicoccus sciuri]